jgi:hypothetical protein
MGKDREGKFHTRKGRPSGKGTSKGFDGHEDAAEIEQQLQMEEQLNVGETGTPDTMRHPNRNTNKGSSGRLSVNTRRKPAKATRTLTSDNTNRPEQTAAIQEGMTTAMSRETFNQLDATPGTHFFSFYMPTHQSGLEVNEQHDRIAFKTAVQRMAAHLEQEEQSAAREMLLSTSGDIVSNDRFWRSQGKGLAVLLTENFVRLIKLPFSPGQIAISNRRFYLSPLLPLIMNREYFYILLLSKKQAKVFRADRYSISPVTVSELPDGIEDVVHFENKDNEGLFRTGSSGGGGGANFHGLGESGPDHKENIAMYLKEVDKTLHQYLLGQESVPLLLAGVDYLLSIYRKVSVYGHISDEQIEGSAEYKDLFTLHDEAMTRMKGYFEESKRDAIESYGVKSDTSRVSTQAAEIIPAAHFSRVSKLFVREGAQIWGRFDEADSRLLIHSVQEPGDDSLIDRAIVKTIANGGDAYVLPENEMPGLADMAAVMRFDA